MKILIVDDALFMRATLRQILEPLGYEILEAENGEQAVAIASDWNPDLITMDIVMPEMDGLAALAEIRRRGLNVLVIMVTAVEQRQPMLEAMRLGISDFIVKPFDESRVISSLDRALNRKQFSGTLLHQNA